MIAAGIADEAPAIPVARAQAARLAVALGAVSLALGFGVGVLSGVTTGIGQLFHVSAGELNWVNSIQLLSTVICVPIIGRLGDMFGHRRMLIGAVAVTTAGGVLIAAAPSFAVFLSGRALQGLIGSLYGLGPAIARDRLSENRGNTVIAALSGCGLLGSVAGLLCALSLGGTADGVRVVLWSSAAVFAAATALCAVAPESVSRASAAVDWRGAVVFAVGLAGLVFGLRQVQISGWSDALTISYLAAGVLVLAGWSRLEARSKNPFIRINGLVNRRVLPSCAIAFAFGVAEFGSQTAAITFLGSPGGKLGYGLSMSIHDIALWLIPCQVAGFAAAILAARLAVVIGNRAAFLSGGGLLAAGFGLMIGWHQTTAEFVLALIVQTAGIGVTQATALAVLSDAADRTGRGVVTSFGESLKVLGGGLSTVAFATLEGSLVIAHTTIPTEHAYLWVWGICGLLSATIIPLALILPRHRAAAEELTSVTGACG